MIFFNSPDFKKNFAHYCFEISGISTEIDRANRSLTKLLQRFLLQLDLSISLKRGLCANI